MGTYTKDILKLVLLLSSLQLSAEGKPLTSRCSQISQIELYYPADPGAENTCVQCPECPAGLGLTPQCGSKVSNDTKIECIQCQANVSYSNSHGIESCKACQVCGLKNVIRHCSPDKNRICGTKCPQGYFLDDNHICQECYFCCGNVSEAQRRQECKDIGMSRDWQCEKTEQNQRCNEDLKKVTPLPTSTTSTAETAPHNHNTMSKKHFQLPVHDNANNVTHLTTKSFTGSKSTQHGTIPITSHGGEVAMWPVNDDSRSSIPETKKEDGQGKQGGTSVGPFTGGAVIFVLISTVVLVASRKRIKKYFSGTKKSETADSIELAPLSTSEPTDSGRSSPHDDNLTNEVFAEEIEEPNLGNIPADCRVSEIEQLRNHNGEPMLFFVQRKLDVPGTPNRKTWRSIGRVMKVSSDDLDLIEAVYKAERSPTEALLAKLKTFTPEPTMKEFVQALVICQRNDVAGYICNWEWERLFKSVENESPL